MPSEERIRTNGIELRVMTEGEGPLVLLLHGWPESWYSWRHQIPALAAAGYRVVAPDLRGYGESDQPRAVNEYTVQKHLGDTLGLLDHFGARDCVLVGHDWGALLTWQFAQLAPERFRGVVGLSVPHMGRMPAKPTDLFKARFGDDFFYILYFQQDGVAEAEFDADPRGILVRLYASLNNEDIDEPTITDPKASAGGWIGRIGKPRSLPAWLKQEDLDYYVSQFEHAGFRGGINFYRCFDHNWESTPELAGRKIEQPSTFIAGYDDMVIAESRDDVEALQAPHFADLRGCTVIPGAGHWVQQEKPEEVNAALLSFLKGL